MTEPGLRFLDGGGELGERLRATDWAPTPLGPVDAWPAALRTLVSLMLASNQPMYIVWGPSRTFLYNDHYATILADKHPWALGRDILDEVWPEIRAELAPIVESVSAGEPVQVPRMRLVLERKGFPEETWFSYFFAPVRDDTGAVAGMFGACNDITGQVQLERSLAERDARHRQVLANMEEAFVLFDHDFRLLEVNTETERLLGMDRETLIGGVQWTLYPGTFDAPLGAMYRRVMARRHAESMDYPHVFQDGREVWFEVRAFPVDQGMAVLFHDVTHRREEHEAATRSAERVQLALEERDHALALLRSFTEAVPGVAYAKDLQGRLLVGNRGVSTLLGVPPEGFIGRTDRELLADPAQAEEVMANDRRIMETGIAEQVEEEIQLADGTPATWISTKAPLLDDDGKLVGLIGASIDITDRKRVERDLRLSEQRGALALEVAQLGTWTWNLAEDVIRFDRRTAEIWGANPERGDYSREDLGRRVHPDDWPRVDAALAAAFTPGGDGRVAEEFRLRHRDGRVVWTMTRGQVAFEGEGDALRPVSMIGTVLDVTERRQLIETLEQSDRRKDEFLAMLAHELRNPLAPIGTAAELLRLVPDDAPRVEEAARIISRQVAHMTEMVDDLLDVSRVTRGLVVFDREPVDMRAVVNAAVEQAGPALQARRHGLSVETGGGPAIVLGDRHRLVQVVSNLLNNAAKYTSPGGRIRVAVIGSEDTVAVQVADNGQGMDASLVNHAFDLFTQAARTPDRSQGGLGIGLALVRSIVRGHGGTVGAVSPGPGCGSTFEFVLPRAAVERLPDDAAPVPRVATRRQSIMVVDDNRDAADTLATVLELLGHDVTVATDGQQALVLADRRSDWDAFILDIGMPDMTGHELVGHLRRRAGTGSACFIALTGYGQAHDHVTSQAAGFDHHLVKPADVDRIVALLAG